MLPSSHATFVILDDAIATGAVAREEEATLLAWGQREPVWCLPKRYAVICSNTSLPPAHPFPHPEPPKGAPSTT